MADGTRIERLYLSLGLDLSEFDTDLAGAQAHVRQVASGLGRDLRMQRLRMEIDLAGVDNADGSLRGLGVRLGHLNTQMETQRNTVALLNRAYQESVRQLGADATASQRLQERLTREQLTEARLEAQIRQTNTARRERVSAAVNTGVDNTAMMLAPTVAMGAASLSLAVDAVESENLWRESMGSMVNEGNSWAQGLRDDLGLNEVELKKSTGMLNTMFDSMGMGTEKSFELSTNLAKLGYDMASFYNLDPDVAFEKLRAGMTGESEPLKALGINISENTIKNYAYTHSIAQQGAELTDQEKVLASYGAIMEKTKRAQGDMARTLEDPANSIRVLKAQVEQLGVEFGQTLIPALKDFVKTAQGMVAFYNTADEGNKRVMNSFGKLAIEVGGAATGLMALNMIGLGAFNPYLALAAGIALATKELAGYLSEKKKVAEYEESNRLGSAPSKDVAKIRKNQYSGYYEKEVEFDGLFGTGTRWQKVNAEEDANIAKQEKRMELFYARKAQLQSIVEAKTQKPLTKEAIDETLRDEFDEEYSTQKWNDKYERDQEQLARKKDIEDQAIAKRLQANRDLSSEISKLEDSDYKNSIVNINNKVADYKKAKLDEANIAKWAELEKKKARADAQKEYLSDLDKMRQEQISASMSIMQVNAIDQNMLPGQGLNLQGLENQQVALNMMEKTANVARLQEKLSLIQQMTEGEEKGSRRRKELLEQEVAASNEYNKSLVDGVKSAMTEIQNLQNKAMSAGSQALGLLNSMEEKKWNFATSKYETIKVNNDSFLREIASMERDNWNKTSTHTMAQMSQMQQINKQLLDSGIDMGIDISGKDVMAAMRREIDGIPESINQAKASMSDFYAQIEELGSTSIEKYFQEWRDNLTVLKGEMGGGPAIRDNNFFTRQEKTQFNPPTQADLNLQMNGYKNNDLQGITVSDNGLIDQISKLTGAIMNIGGVSGNTPQQSNNQQSSTQGININLQNSVEFKGFTGEEINKAVERAKDAFGQELMSAIQDANSVMGV